MFSLNSEINHINEHSHGDGDGDTHITFAGGRERVIHRGRSRSRSRSSNSNRKIRKKPSSLPDIKYSPDVYFSLYNEMNPFPNETPNGTSLYKYYTFLYKINSSDTTFTKRHKKIKGKIATQFNKVYVDKARMIYTLLPKTDFKTFLAAGRSEGQSLRIEEFIADKNRQIAASPEPSPSKPIEFLSNVFSYYLVKKNVPHVWIYYKLMNNRFLTDKQKQQLGEIYIKVKRLYQAMTMLVRQFRYRRHLNFDLEKIYISMICPIIPMIRKLNYAEEYNLSF